MTTQTKPGEEYKVVKENSRSKKIAMLFSIAWALLVITPATYLIYKNSDSLRNYVVVKMVYETNKSLISEYDNLSKDLISKINISKYTKNIKVPEIKLDNISNATAKVEKTTSALSKFGIKGIDKIADTSSSLNAEVDKINKQIKKSTEDLTKTLEQDINKALKDELASLGRNQMQKQLRLNDTNYKNLIADRYGMATEAERKITSSIYNEISRDKTPIVKNVIKFTDDYFNYISLGLMGLAILITLIPIYIAFKIAKILSKNFNTCPYCGKIYISKSGKFGFLSILKFWK